jgi:hypothetical protein
LRKSLPDKVQKALNLFLSALKGKYSDAVVYLFGSYARGDWLEDSDLDILVISSRFKGKQMVERVGEIRRLAPEDVPMEILAYTPEEFKKALKRSEVIKDASTCWVKLTKDRPNAK